MRSSNIFGRIFSLAVLLFFSIHPAFAKTEDDGEQLLKTMAEISLLNNQMAQRKVDAENIRDALIKQLKSIQSETRDELKKKKIGSENKAKKDPRIRHNMMLIAEISAYIDRYTQKIRYYRVACDRLTYLYQKADDDLKIVSTLSGLKIDALIDQANRLIDDYMPQAQTILLSPQTITIKEPDQYLKGFALK